MRNRLTAFVLWCVFFLIVYSIPTIRFVRVALQRGYTSHIVAIPFIVAYLVWSNRARVFREVQYDLVPAFVTAGLALIVLAVTPFGAKLGYDLDSLLLVLSLELFIVAVFFGCFGAKAVRASRFPLFLLIFMLPWPAVLLERVVFFLQVRSADLTLLIFKALGVPVLRNDFVFTLPGVNIEVAKECSGINSSIALFLLMILVAHETLQGKWMRVALVVLVIPLSIIKNAIRIATLTTLAIRVDPGFLTGRLHHDGGIVFFLLTLSLLYPIWRALRFLDAKYQRD